MTDLNKHIMDDSEYKSRANDLRFESSKKAIKQLHEANALDFERNLKIAASLITSINSIAKYHEYMNYDQSITINKLDKYSVNLIHTINSLYNTVYDKSTEDLENTKKTYLNAIIAGKGGDTYTKSQYIKEINGLKYIQDPNKREKLYTYLRNDLKIYEEAKNEVEKRNPEYKYAIESGKEGRQVQVMQVIFMQKDLSEFQNINFTQIEKLIKRIKDNSDYIRVSNEQLYNVMADIKELKDMLSYCLSYPGEKPLEADSGINRYMRRDNK